MQSFQTDSKRMLELMIHSVYTHHEIFLRELISNASDAIDKLYFRSLTDDSVSLTREDYKITITADKAAGTLTVADNGCGMDEAALHKNLGVVAHSDTRTFKEDKDTLESIGQFGVGFYASFMVAEKVEVISRPYGEETAWHWVSEGADGYEITKTTKESHGTDIILHLRKDEADDGESGENQDKYRKSLQESTLQGIVAKYSDYIRYPIQMLLPETTLKEGCDGTEEDAYETHDEWITLNSMVPIWRKPKSERTDEEMNDFYKTKFHDYEDPLLTIQYSVEGNLTYTALLFIPKSIPFNFYAKDYQKGLQLYANGVLIQDKCADLLPDTFGFVRGLVDSGDLSLNISRELLQQNKQLQTMAKNIEKKVRAELHKLLADDREKYEVFYKAFGLQLKYGIYHSFGMNKEETQDLLLFHSLAEDKLIGFKEYRAAMPEGQKAIYYVCAENAKKAAMLPQTETVRAKGFDVLCLTDNVDEFAMKAIMTYDSLEIRSISADEIEVDAAEKERAQKLAAQYKDTLEKMGKFLDGKAARVEISTRLARYPVCLSSEGGVSIEMEKILSALPTDGQDVPKAKRVLELNPDHPLFVVLTAADDDKLELFTDLLYQQALMIEGLPPEDPAGFSEKVCKLMTTQ